VSVAPNLPRDPFALAALVLAVDPSGVGGAILRGPGGPATEAWLGLLRHHLPPETPWRRLPSGVTPDRLVGGVDLSRTVAQGVRVLQPGLLAECDGGLVVVPSAERLPPETVPPLLEALDRGRVRVEREGLSADSPARAALVLLDESREEEGGAPEALQDRLALLLTLPPRWLPAGREGSPSGQSPPSHLPRGSIRPWERGALSVPEPAGGAEAIRQARDLLPRVQVPEERIRELTLLAQEGGQASLRPVLRALQVARILAALRGEVQVTPGDGSWAALLVLAPRGAPIPVTPDHEDAPGDPEPQEGPDPARAPPQQDSSSPTEPPPPPPPPVSAGSSHGAEEMEAEPAQPALPDRWVEAVRALLPEEGADPRRLRGRPIRARAGGRGGTATRAHERGRRVGALPGAPTRGRRLDLSATLRAAAPWQRLRRTASDTPALTEGDRGEGRGGLGEAGEEGIRVLREDLHVQRRIRPALRRMILVVDASGSQAIRRLGEVKGAVELLLAGSYRRREEVALVVFRNREAELVLPPTRSLTRARRLLRGLPGGGGTPLPRALGLALRLSAEARREGVEGEIVLLSDGRPNVDLQGRGDRRQAREDALALAGALGARGSPLRILDTSLRGEPFLAALALRSGGAVDHLPFADARRLEAALARDGERHPHHRSPGREPRVGRTP
jgi:magnesium chelatase subunit D